MKDLESYGKKIVDYINKYYNEIDIEEYLKKEILCISKEKCNFFTERKYWNKQ